MSEETEDFQIVEVKAEEVLGAITRSEIDMQISTAKKYPRDIAESLKKIETYATIDKEIALSCFYELERKDKNKEVKIIEGESIRFAEIVASCWGNMRVQTRVSSNDGRKITVTGVCHDLESNLATSIEVTKGITYSGGGTFNNDLQILAINSASSVAYRNCVLKVVPKGLLKPLIDRIKKHSVDTIDLSKDIEPMVKFFLDKNITESIILHYVSKGSLEELSKPDVAKLRRLANAINDGLTTPEEFIKRFIDDSKGESKEQEQGNPSAKKVVEKIEGAMNTSEQPATLFETPKK